jgi:hypothetical protein
MGSKPARPIPEASVVRQPSRSREGWWCTHRASQPAQDFCSQEPADCEAQRAADWTECSEKERVFCHDVSRKPNHIIDRRDICYETEEACSRSARAFSPATNMRAGPCFTRGSDGRIVRPRPR